jgi:hypothetical protein
VIKGPGVVGPLDRLAAVGPSEPPPAERAASAGPATPAATVREGLESRQARWHEERERFERRRGPAAGPGGSSDQA